ncbi:MAG: polysaccharide export protein [Rhizobiales bacterium]|nr:polysaccharide export protein [Hyphomicrobiales bacterium]
MSVRVGSIVLLLAALLAGCSHMGQTSVKDVALSDEEAVIAVAIASHRSHAEPEPASDDTYSEPVEHAYGEPVHIDRRTTTTAIEPVQALNYRLDTGDQVRVFVYGQPNLSRVYTLDGEGFISVPLISAVKARGLTTFELEARIAARLSVEYIRDPKVSIEIAAHRPVYVLGEVRSAGQFPYSAGLTARRLVALAGGFTPRADKLGLRVTRVIEGNRETHELRLDEDLLPGDVITVGERWF